MAKELPYFKFYINEWVNGDITLEDYELQGIFINVCGYYWSKDCDLSLVNLRKKFRGFDDKIDELIKSRIIKIDEGMVLISFLNEQLSSKEVQIVTNRINGMLGGRPKKIITEEKPNGLNFANPNETESITEMKANDNPNVTNIEESKVEDIKVITQVVPTSDIDFDKFIKVFNGFTGRKFRPTEKLKTSLKARLRDYSKNEIVEAIKNAHEDSYHKENNFKYLTPEFILRPDKLEKFLNQPEKSANAYNPAHPQLTN